jgi:hypothetical protein
LLDRELHVGRDQPRADSKKSGRLSLGRVVGVLFIGAVALFGWFLIHNPDTSEQWNSQRPEHAESVPAEIKAQDLEFADVAGATATAWA